MSNELDIARALLSAHARRSTVATPVHIVQIAADLRRREIESSALDLMNTLQVMREAQHINNGFWIPAPTSVIANDDLTLAISGCPTAELQRTFSVQRAKFGAARLVTGMKPIGVSWSQWTCAPTDSVQWAKREITRYLSERTMVKGDQLSFEFYPHWQSDTRRWSTDSAYTGVALCRLTGPLGMHQHYLCELERGIIRSVADIPQDTDFRFRMQIALSKTAGLPQKYVVRKSASSAQIAVRPLPTPELRVLTALASIEMAGQALNAKMELGHYHVVKATLASLGLEEIEK